MSACCSTQRTEADQRTGTDEQTLTEVVDQLDKILFDDFIRRKTNDLRDVIKGGILESNVDWYRAPKPRGEEPTKPFTTFPC